MEPQTLIPITGPEILFLGGIIAGLIIGVPLGMLIARRSKKPDNAITSLQIMAFLVLFLYVLTSYIFAHEPSWPIAIGILATGYGAKGGEILEQILERKK